jgi:hypothetical protein
MMELVNEYIDQCQLVEAMEEEACWDHAEVEYLVRLGNDVGEMIALDSQVKQEIAFAEACGYELM